MSKAKRLNEMIMMVNRKKRFTVRELSEEFGVSKRTILRDLQELSEMGVPLYSEVGPHGGYQVLHERILPPIAFTEDEVVSIFFAIRGLRNYVSLPFHSEYESIERKFYLNLSGDMRETIDKMADRVDFVTVFQRQDLPNLKQLLEASIEQKVIVIEYENTNKKSKRSIQPIGIYAKNGHWYCPAYCFLSKDYRVFRCDRIRSVMFDEERNPLNLKEYTLKNRFELQKKPLESLTLHVELTTAGLEKYQLEIWPNLVLHKRNDGSGFITGKMTEQDIPFYSNVFISLGKNASVESPVELIEYIKSVLMELLDHYVEHLDM
ncbi:helix-turn-helix transcriptional regulator [Ferdinandcohnia quinoae]|uniref:YafY family transcriptional regulator n=1 Tax=Fredinandcohnia quinoae TaxID=2918902 RepID=A0AAW5E1Q1_9BACI|nr:YafY family protein [Fredinandcohnia sp. SECRCQ15]MCH1624027.1 YafY family transcriptional regulator [Fredinandcohnia sp. SECRCQ15]